MTPYPVSLKDDTFGSKLCAACVYPEYKALVSYVYCWLGIFELCLELWISVCYHLVLIHGDFAVNKWRSKNDPFSWGAKMSDMRNQDPWKWLILKGMNRMFSVCGSCVKELGRNWGSKHLQDNYNSCLWLPGLNSCDTIIFNLCNKYINQ